MPELACYAAREETSRGRRYHETGPMHRNNYQRDRDRIIHSSAFRRLEYKTQVFVNHEGDMFRTRLTHSIEVSQIGRTIARALHLNEDLTEAICLAHDLGHTPFGHAGQDILDVCMKDHGGFEHNLQSLRVVDVLEERYAEFPGLNLMFDTREGILKHCSRNNARKLGELGQRFLDGTQPGLEAQVANIADEIAYNNHDVDDGLRAGLITVRQLEDCSLFARQKQVVEKLWPELEQRRTVHEIIRRMISSLVCDLVDHSQVQLNFMQPPDIAAIRAMKKPVIGLSEEILAMHLELKKFLHENLYRHERVSEMTDRAREIIRRLFEIYIQDTSMLPADFRKKCAGAGEAETARVVADYIAGMTDRYAFAEHARLCSG